jgi:hypothetical protein
MNAIPIEMIKAITVEDLMKFAAQHPDVHIEVVNGDMVEKMGAGTLHYIVTVLLLKIRWLESVII